jgi:formiminotetrahydrofolate cyclodeaminase
MQEFLGVETSMARQFPEFPARTTGFGYSAGGPGRMACPGVLDMLDGFISRLEQARPDPGGGAACAHGALVGLALVRKVVLLELSRDSKQDGSKDGRLTSISTVEALQNQCLALREKDTEAYLNMARVRASEDSSEKFSAALAQAIECPCRIIDTSLVALDCVLQTARNCKKHLLPDLMVAAEFLAAAINGAAHIALANVKLVLDPEARQRWSRRLDEGKHKSRERLQAIRGALPPM